MQLVDLRQIIAGTAEFGHRLDPRDDMISTLFDIINMLDIKGAQRSQEFDEASVGGDDEDNASDCSAGSRRDAPHPDYRVEARLGNTEDAELAAATTAKDVAAWERQRRGVSDEALLFSPAKPGQAGAGSSVGPASHGDAESFHASGIVSVMQ